MNSNRWKNHLAAMEKSRRGFADRMENLAGAKEAELIRLRTQIRAGQPGSGAPVPKKVIVDDEEPVKKPVKKKPVPKPAAKAGTAAGATSPASATPAPAKTQ